MAPELENPEPENPEVEIPDVEIPDVEIHVNGEVRRVPAGIDIEQLLAHLGVPGQRVGVERNRELVPRARFGSTRVSAGDRFEIVAFVGGG